jgi:hypothetical protein
VVADDDGRRHLGINPGEAEFLAPSHDRVGKVLPWYRCERAAEPAVLLRIMGNAEADIEKRVAAPRKPSGVRQESYGDREKWLAVEAAVGWPQLGEEPFVGQHHSRDDAVGLAVEEVPLVCRDVARAWQGAEDPRHPVLRPEVGIVLLQLRSLPGRSVVPNR